MVEKEDRSNYLIVEKEGMNGELQIRDPELYSESLKEILKLLTLNETPVVVGSTAYLAHKYPSDVDVFEKVYVDLPREEAALFYWDQFKIMMERLLINSYDLFITDFKVGEDVRFAQIGTEEEIVERLHQAGLLTRDLVEAMGTGKFKETLRKKRTLRWSPEEVLTGVKELPKGLEIHFVDAVSSPAIVKLDTVTWISGRFQSVELFYNLTYRGGEFYPLGSHAKGFLNDIEKYSQPETYAPLKLAKRLWSLSRVIECQDLLMALNPLLSSDMAALNQIRTDIETIDLFIENPLREYQVTRLFTEILGFHKRITNHLTGDAYLQCHLLLDKIFNYWKTWQGDRLPREFILDTLDDVSEILRLEINVRSEEFLRAVEQLNITCNNPRFKHLI